MKIIGSQIIFDDGTEAYANCGIIGLAPDDDCIYGGYDQVVDQYDKSIDYRILTKNQKKEVAEYMINLWTKLRDELDEKT